VLGQLRALEVDESCADEHFLGPVTARWISSVPIEASA
jgi:hypothetical protein